MEVYHCLQSFIKPFPYLTTIDFLLIDLDFVLESSYIMVSMALGASTLKIHRNYLSYPKILVSFWKIHYFQLLILWEKNLEKMPPTLLNFFI